MLLAANYALCCFCDHVFQVDRPSFPCICTTTGCNNPFGRREFDEAVVHEHFRSTLMRTQTAQNRKVCVPFLMNFLLSVFCLYTFLVLFSSAIAFRRCICVLMMDDWCLGNYFLKSDQFQKWSSTGRISKENKKENCFLKLTPIFVHSLLAIVV